MASRNASTRWTGSLRKGSGRLSLDSSNLGQFDVSFATRFESPDGQTSPEELIAAAQSSCLAMNLSGVLAGAGLEAEYIDVSAEVTVRPQPAGGFRITTVAITLRAKLAGVDPDQFAELAQKAKDTCPVSNALAGTTIILDAALA